MFVRLQEAHSRPKDCPMRSSRLRYHGFTNAMRDSWLGHLWLVETDCTIPFGLLNHVVNHLASPIGIYGPFIESTNQA